MKHRIRERAIFALLDGRLGDAESDKLHKHLKECEACRNFHQRAAEVRAELRSMAATSPPPVDWDKVEAGLPKESAQPRGAVLGTYLLWGSLAAASAAAFLITWLVAAPARDGDEPTAREDAPRPEKTAQADATLPEREAPRTVEGFVTFIAGEAGLSTPATEWTALSLESPLEAGTRLRTGQRSAAGFQLGEGSVCRLEEQSEVQVRQLGSPELQLGLEQGRLTCASSPEGSEPTLELAVMNVVASASGATRFSAHQEAQVVVIELAEGRLTISPEGGDEGQTLDQAGRYLVHMAGEEGQLVVEADQAQAGAPTLAALPAAGSRTISSLQLPPLPGIDRVEVDGIDYGVLPLQLRHRPGTVGLRLFSAGQEEPLVRVVEIGLGPRVLEVASLDLGELAEPRGPTTLSLPPQERRVAPRIGTYNEAQVRQLRAVVSRTVRGCYERMLKRNPSVWGRIGVRFTVSTSGEPRRVEVQSLAGGHGDVNSCIESTLSHQVFPAPVGGHIPVEQTITLSPQF